MFSGLKESIAGVKYSWGFLNNRIAALDQIAQERGAVAPFTFPPNIPMCLLTSAEGVGYVLKSDKYEKGPVWANQAKILVPGLLNLEGEEYQQLREMAQGYFTPNRVITTSSTAIELIDEHFTQVQGDQKSPKKLNARKASSALQLDIAARTFVGGDFQITPELQQSINTVLTYLDKSTLTALHLPPAMQPTSFLPDYRAAMEHIKRTILREVKQRRQAAVDDKTLLDHLLKHSQDDEKISDVLIESIFAGHETTALAETWLLYCIGRNPDIFEKVQHEVDTVLKGAKPQLKSMADLKNLRSNLPYTSAVIKEALRLYPPAWATFRQAKEDDVIGDTNIAKGTNMMISFYHQNRDLDKYSSPNTFDPTREDTKPSHVSPSFGTGERVCIGQHKAMLDLLLFSIRFAQSFTVDQKIPHEVGARGGFSLYPESDIELSLSPRPKDILEIEKNVEANQEGTRFDIETSLNK